MDAPNEALTWEKVNGRGRDLTDANKAGDPPDRDGPASIEGWGTACRGQRELRDSKAQDGGRRRPDHLPLMKTYVSGDDSDEKKYKKIL
jgi:hypothetical protein